MPESFEQRIDRHAERKVRWIINSMFIDTADENYIVARWAFANDFDTDFYWLALHAVEKYMKSILMLNGVSSKGFGHDISKLQDAIHLIDDRVIRGEFEYPPWIPAQYLFRKENISEFITKLGKNGNPSNRYDSAGHELGSEDIHRLDYLIWELRRHCCKFEELGTDSNAQERNIDRLVRENKPLSYTGKLFDIINGVDSEKKNILLNYNYAFDPKGAKAPDRMRSAAGWGSLYWTAMDLRDKHVDANNYASSRKAIDWVLLNMQIGKEDLLFIKEQEEKGK